jgi:hypothetical protein
MAQAPLEYTPVGWYIYKTMGPCAEKEARSQLLDVGDWPRNKRGDKDSNIPDGGRSSAREGAAKQKELERQLDWKNKRVVPKKELLVLSEAESSAEQQNHESNILALSQVIKSLHKRVDMYSKLIATIGTTGVEIYLL